MSLRRLTARLLEPDARNVFMSPGGAGAKSPALVRLSRWIDFSLISLILLSVIAFMLETEPGIRNRFLTQFFWLERMVVLIFSIEYLLRVWTAPEQSTYAHLPPWRARLRWMTSPMGVIDLMAILPFYLSLIFAFDGALALLLRAARLLRIFKLTRYSPALGILKGVITKEGPTLLVIMMLLFVLLVFSSWAMYLFERNAQPENFASIPKAMWWAIVSLTTVGYGDVVPVTAAGRLFAGLIALMGVAVVALPAGILASGFSSEFQRRNTTYQDALENALTDGALSKEEVRVLRLLREQLGIPRDDAEALLSHAERQANASSEPSRCPHCGKNTE